MYCRCYTYNQVPSYGLNIGYHPEYAVPTYSPYMPSLPVPIPDQRRNFFLSANITNGNIDIGLRPHQESSDGASSSVSSTNSSMNGGDKSISRSPSPSVDSTESNSSPRRDHSPGLHDVKQEQGVFSYLVAYFSCAIVPMFLAFLRFIYHLFREQTQRRHILSG